MSLVKAAAVGALGGLLGSGATAKQNMKIAKKQMDFQERMSNTAYQRAAKDLEAAGLNRILALGSPATTPGGAGFAAPDFGSALTGGAQSGIALASTGKQMEQMQAQIDKLVAETSLTGTKQMQELEKTKLWQTIGPIIGQAGKDFSALIGYLRGGAIEDTLANLNMTQKSVRETLHQLLKEIYGSRYTGSTLPRIIVDQNEPSIKIPN